MSNLLFPFEHRFISWCPETKLEDRPFSLVYGEEIGTRNGIAMLLMSLCFVETRQADTWWWVRVLRRVAKEQ